MSPEEAKAMHYAGKPVEFVIPEGVEGPVYCVGDSHVSVLQGVCPVIFAPTHWGFEDSETVYLSKTAYAIGSDGHGGFLEKSFRSIPQGSKVLMSFGEIDCRHYLPRFAKERGISPSDLVDEVIARYKMQCLNRFLEKYRLIILGAYVTPNDHNNPEAYEAIFECKRLLNKRLEEYCAETGALFVPIFRIAQEEEWDRHPVGTYFGDLTHASGCMVPVILNAMAGYKWKGFDT